MHTDEYEISLARELAVCRKVMRKLQKSLLTMERKYNMPTDTFVEAYRGEGFSSLNKDFTKWMETYEALRRWKQRATEFGELFHRMKV